MNHFRCHLTQAYTAYGLVTDYVRVAQESDVIFFVRVFPKYFMKCALPSMKIEDVVSASDLNQVNIVSFCVHAKHVMIIFVVWCSYSGRQWIDRHCWICRVFTKWSVVIGRHQYVQQQGNSSRISHCCPHMYEFYHYRKPRRNRPWKDLCQIRANIWKYN